MNKKQSLFIAAVLLLILALLIMYIGFSSASKILWPPIITGAGFLVIAWIFFMHRKE